MDKKLTKKELIRKETWKFFWKQKALEILIVIAVITLAYIIGLLLPNSMCDNFVGKWILGLGIMFFIIFVLVSIIIILRDFIKSNWRKAEKKAKIKIENG